MEKNIMNIVIKKISDTEKKIVGDGIRIHDRLIQSLTR